MELKKGNWDNLEGTVLIYSKLKNFKNPGESITDKNGKHPLPDGSVMNLYCSFDITNFVNAVGVPKEVLEDIIKKAKDSIENKFKEDGIHSSVKMDDPLCIAPLINIRTEEELFSNPLKGDILFVGNYDNEEDIGRFMNIATTYYFDRFHKQMKRGLPLESNGNTEIFSMKTYEDIEKGQLKGYLSKEFIVPMVGSAGIDVQQMNRYIRAFVRFSEISAVSKHISTDVHELCRHVQDNRTNINKELIETYLNKMDAIHREDYEEAAKYRDEIIKLK